MDLNIIMITLLFLFSNFFSVHQDMIIDTCFNKERRRERKRTTSLLKINLKPRRKERKEKKQMKIVDLYEH